ncbi:TPA: autotransporter outer membrane beta-barrel domain-containing protein [Salmonella enterica]|nr:autotransporter outer membrane beta-barrel domain-containing protein [Salmonella enterica]
MAVENKFRLNVIAASVLMGLSLSAMAEGGTSSATTTPAETTPAKPATLAELAAPVSTSKITVNIPDKGNDTPLDKVFDKAQSGYVANLRESYNTALGKLNNLTATQQSFITKLNSAMSAKKDATQTWNELGNKLSAANSVYTDSLNSMYGDNKNAFKVDSSGKPVADAKKSDNSTYGQLLNAYDSLKTSVENLNKVIVGDTVNDTSHTALQAFGDVGKKEAAQTAEAKVIAYSNYINKVINTKTKELQLESVRNIVINNISTVLGQVDKADGIGDTASDGVGKNLAAFQSAYQNWSQATTQANKDAAETKLASTFSTLVNTASISDLGNTVIPGSDRVTLKNLAAAWKTLTSDDSTEGSVAQALAAEHTAMDFSQGTEITNSANAAIAAFKDNHKGLLDSADALKEDGDPKDLNDALSKLQAAYQVLLNKDTGANPTELKSLASLIQKVKDDHSQMSGIQADYTQKKLALQQAGTARLNLLLNELPGQQQKLLTAQSNYQTAVKNITSDKDAQAAIDAWKGLYGNDGNGGALGAYLDSLKKTSGGLDDAFATAESTYQGVVNSKTSTQAQKNTALYNLIGTQKTLTEAKLKLDTAYLNLLNKGAPVAASSSSITNNFKNLDTLKADLNTAATNKAEAKAQYVDAVKAYRDADSAYQASKSEADAATLATAKAKLMTVVGITSPSDFSKLYVNNTDMTQGFKSFDNLSALTADNSDVIGKYNAALAALDTTSDGGTEIQKARKAVVGDMNRLSGLMPLSSSGEQAGYRTAYNNALKEVGVQLASVDEQSKAPGAGKVTHILGSLNADEIAHYDPVSGNYNSVILNADGKGMKDSFTANDLYTGTQDNPFTTTVLDIRALELGNGLLADPNTITVGEAGSKDKKATPVEVWAKTAGAKHQDDDGTKPYVNAENGPAVKLSGNLRTATAQLDADGKPVNNETVRGADQIHLQNVNIHNSFTLADKVQMLKNDVAALNQQAADKIALAQPAEGDSGVNTWLKTQTDLLNSKYDNLGLTGLQIDTTTVNPTFDLNTAGWKNAEKTVIPTDPNILLDNLNITLQNDSVGGTSTAIDLSGTGNHIQANGGVFDAGSVTGTGAQANALYITDTGTNNLIDFNGSVLKGDIRSDAAGNTVNLTNGSLTGDAIAATGKLSLNLDNSVWTGGAGSASPDVVLKNNSAWNVEGYHFNVDTNNFPESSVNSLTLNGNNSLNLVHADGMAQLGGHGFAGAKYATTLNVDTDLTSDGKGVTSVLAGTYSPDNLHGLTNTGSADNYQFGTLDVKGLATGGKYALSLESSGAEPYTIGGRLADGPEATHAHDFVSYMTSESRVVTDGSGNPVTQTVKSDADFTSLSAPAELGVYQYAAEKVMDGVNNRTNIYYRSTGQLSNSAATVVSLAAAPVDVANLESDTLAKHMNSVRHGKDSGVWVSYFGGENRNTTASGPEYKLNTSGVMLGADTLTENNWLAGVAVSSARSDMSVMNSSGDLNSYGAQFYMSRRYDSGVFVDSALQFNHFSNTAKARMTDGQQAKADFSGNSYGLEAKVGYAWNSEGFFAEPYVRAAARVFDGEHYALSNGMTVNSNDYKSMLGEVGADLGYQYAISGGYVKPYLHLAALNEFADGNSVRVNNVSLDDSVKGAAFQAGLGAEVKVTDNLGGYAAFDYTKGDNTERPWQATVGVNYTW